MDSYAEYPIRCQTCNSQLSCLSEPYEEYLQAGFSIKESLDELRLTRYCCRIAMMNPINVTFNMENREVIEGLEKVEMTDEPNDHESSGEAIFGSCLAKSNQNQVNPITAQIANLTVDQRQLLINPKLPKPTVQLRLPGQIGAQVPTIGQIGIRVGDMLAQGLPTIAPLNNLQPLTPEQPVVIPEIGGADTPVEIEGHEQTEFLIPDRVGIPTINTDPTKGSRYIHVGPGRQKPIKVLSGCTFLAQ